MFAMAVPIVISSIIVCMGNLVVLVGIKTGAQSFKAVVVVTPMQSYSATRLFASVLIHSQQPLSQLPQSRPRPQHQSMSARKTRIVVTPMLIAQIRSPHTIVLAMLDGQATVLLASMSMSALSTRTIAMPMDFVATPLAHSNVHVMTVTMAMA